MPRPRNITDEEILETARAVFLEQGARVSTAVVAKRIGISQAVLFQRFGTKENLLIEALKPPKNPKWAELLRRGPDDRLIPEQLLEIAQAISLFLRDAVPCIAVMKSAGVDFDQVWKSELKEAPPFRAQRLIGEWLDRAQQQGKITSRITTVDLATAFAGALQARPFMAHMASIELPPVESDPYLESLVEIIWRGVAPEEVS
jgi:AcrR family transcriptional regulator